MKEKQPDLVRTAMGKDAVLSRSNKLLVWAVEIGDSRQRLTVVFYASLLSDGKRNLGRSASSFPFLSYIKNLVVILEVCTRLDILNLSVLLLYTVSDFA